MKRVSLLSISLIFLIFQKSIGQPVSHESVPVQAFSLKPINFSNIELGQNGGFEGYPFGIAYERLFQPESHWSWVIPVTYGFYNTFLITDYKKKGHQLYFSPGIKYYLKTNQPWKGWSASFNTMLGWSRFDYNSKIVSKGHVKETFYGLLASWIYNAPVGKTTAINFELGFGIRYNKTSKRWKSNVTQDFPPYSTIDYLIENDNRLTGMMNISIGISKWF